MGGQSCATFVHMTAYPQPDHKRCSACGETKPRSDYYLAAPGMPGLRPYCKPCHAARRRQAYQTAGGRDATYDRHLRREYGITLDDYNRLLRKQRNRCACCGDRATASSHRLGVDYNAEKKEVRGLVCRRCILVVAALVDDVGRGAAVVAYVGMHFPPNGQ